MAVANRGAARVLIVEDDPAVRLSLQYMCRREGFDVLEASSGVHALALFEETHPDLVLLDLMLPGMGGLDVCRAIRRREPAQPVIILTARGDETDKVTGLEIGADDYVTKPFSPRELLARMRAVLRRSGRAGEQPVPTQVVSVGGLTIDLGARLVHRDGEELGLTRTEFDLLAALAQQPGQALARDALVVKVWGYETEGGTRLLDSHIGHLRAKIEPDARRSRYILTVRGIGYRLRPEASPPGDGAAPK